jgi:chromosome segregation ATPase
MEAAGFAAGAGEQIGKTLKNSEEEYVEDYLLETLVRLQLRTRLLQNNGAEIDPEMAWLLETLDDMYPSVKATYVQRRDLQRQLWACRGDVSELMEELTEARALTHDYRESLKRAEGERLKIRQELVESNEVCVKLRKELERTRVELAGVQKQHANVKAALDLADEMTDAADEENDRLCSRLRKLERHLSKVKDATRTCSIM